MQHKHKKSLPTNILTILFICWCEYPPPTFQPLLLHSFPSVYLLQVSTFSSPLLTLTPSFSSSLIYTSLNTSFSMPPTLISSFLYWKFPQKQILRYNHLAKKLHWSFLCFGRNQLNFHDHTYIRLMQCLTNGPTPKSNTAATINKIHLHH